MEPKSRRGINKPPAMTNSFNCPEVLPSTATGIWHKHSFSTWPHPKDPLCNPGISPLKMLCLFLASSCALSSAINLRNSNSSLIAKPLFWAASSKWGLARYLPLEWKIDDKSIGMKPCIPVPVQLKVSSNCCSVPAASFAWKCAVT